VSSRRPPVIALTIATGSLAGLAELLRAGGAVVREVPLLTFAPPADWEPLDNALQRLSTYAAMALTSPRAAEAVAARAAALRIAAPPALAVWASGEATAAPLQERFGPVQLPSGLVTIDAGAGSTLAGALLASRVGSPILFPCGDTRRDELPSILRASGIAVHEVTCYRSVLADDAHAREASSEADAILIASPKVAQLVARVTRRGERPALVTIGPTTAAAARAAGWAPDGVAKRPTVEGVAERLRAVLKIH
jgi:uroporphyrinogen-III synthase